MFRAVAAVAAGIFVLLLFLAGATIRLAPSAKKDWREFSMGPPSGVSWTMRPGSLHADGITLQAAIGIAYAVPATHVVAPAWVRDARYAIAAEAPSEDRELFRQLLREELQARFDLAARLASHPFAVYVLSVGSVHDLPDGRSEEQNTRLIDWRAELRGASMDRLAEALQGILGKPVVNETGMSGAFHIEFAWGENPAVSIAEALRHKFGLELTPAQREVQALVVDRIEPDGAASIFRHVGRLTSGAPPGLRRAISRALTIH